MDFRDSWKRAAAALPALAALVFLLVLPAAGARGDVLAGADSSVATPGLAGFAAPVPILPAVGLWVDGSARIGYAKKSGVVLWWGLEPPAPGAGAVDWRRVTFRIRAEAFRPDGKRAARQEDLIEPLHSDGATERGGFPTPIDLVLAPGRYRLHLEAYPLISAQKVGLDSVPHGRADVEMVVPEMSVGSQGWRVSDILFLGTLRKWEPGAAPQRTWYDWVGHPNVSRVFAADTASAYAGFEVLRSSEVVPRCGPGRCRIVITVRDATGGVVQQELRAVPEAGSLQAYVVRFRPGELGPGEYAAEIEIFEGSELQATTRRGFQVTAGGR